MTTKMIRGKSRKMRERTKNSRMRKAGNHYHVK